MGFLVALIKLGVKWAPKSIVLWAVNLKLKGIAEVKDYAVDLDARTVYANTLLFGETEAIEVRAEQFGIILDNGAYKFILQKVNSNKPWLNNTFAFVLGKAFPIPVIPQLAPFMPLAYALLKIELELPEQKVVAAIAAKV